MKKFQIFLKSKVGVSLQYSLIIHKIEFLLVLCYVYPISKALNWQEKFFLPYNCYEVSAHLMSFMRNNDSVYVLKKE